MIPNIFASAIKNLHRFFTSQHIDYVILGGIAVSVYGEPRFTAEIDVNIIMDKAGLDQFFVTARQFSLFPLAPGAERIARETGVVPLKFIKGDETAKVDVIIAENALEFKAIERGRMRSVGSFKARFVSAEDLILHKLTSPRPRDQEDLERILLRQKSKLDLRYVRRWLKKLDDVDPGLGLSGRFESLLEET